MSSRKPEWLRKTSAVRKSPKEKNIGYTVPINTDVLFIWYTEQDTSGRNYDMHFPQSASVVRLPETRR
jgi:hypothetical protein